MGGKKGQVVLFVILGIVLLVAVIIGLFLLNTASKQKKILDETTLQTEAAQLETINSYMKSCLEIAAKDGVYGIMLQSGYDELPLITETTFQGRPIQEYDYVYSPYLGSSYYVIKGQKNMPTINEIKQSIEDRTMLYFIGCVNDFSAFETTNFEFELGEEKSMNIEFAGNKMLFNLNYPFKAKSTTSDYNLGKYTYLLDYELNSKYNNAKLFIDEQIKDLEYINAGYLSWLAHKQGFTFEMWEIAEKTYIFYFVYEDYEKIYNYPLRHSFIVEYA